MRAGLLLFCLLIHTGSVMSQVWLKGTITGPEGPVSYATIAVGESGTGTNTDSMGRFQLQVPEEDTIELHIHCVGYQIKTIEISLPEDSTITIRLQKDEHVIEEVVVTGTMRPISRLDSPIPVEVISPQFFRKNPTPNLFESIGMLNGIKPQLNCNICNTGDIHINGMEGPYTMVLIDGMPIVSSLSTVYGLSGIPNSIVERIEVVKGPASSLYGSEAMGGIINVITKNPSRAPGLSADVMATSWAEVNTDLSFRSSHGKADQILGLNYFNYQQPMDHNKDGFTDVTLQHRLSIFNKWSLKRASAKQASLAGRWVYEDRWGGQMDWGREWRGSDSIYGESIYTRRAELIGIYELPTREPITLQFSYNWHDQDSWYGTTPFMATQQVAFIQAYWNKQVISKHHILLGTAYRYNFYDDNTPATAEADLSGNMPAVTGLPGVYLQDEWRISDVHTLLGGYRWDYDRNHGHIHSPRLAYKWRSGKTHTFRASFGTGFRVVNLFTEDHAALTGAREVVIASELAPERSYNSNLNYVARIAGEQFFTNIDLTAFYSYFTNKIVGDFMADPNKIIYDNLAGYAVSRGTSANVELSFVSGLRLLAGVSFMDVYQMEPDDFGGRRKEQQLFAPQWSGNFVFSYAFPGGWVVDLTGNWYGPMRLPVVPNDFRPEYSPFHCLANIQVTRKFNRQLELYGGIKNLLNFIPSDPILRASDPFDKEINDPIGNPKGYSFDPGYNYAPLQGIRGFLGIRYQMK